jgi:hypothetical protein
MVGGLVGGSSGAQTGAKIGVVAGAARASAQRIEQRHSVSTETQARTEYQSTPAYQDATHSNFNEAPPEVMVPPSSAEAVAAGDEVVFRKNGKPVVGITYPSDWKQKVKEDSVTATSKDGHAWSAAALLSGVKDKEGGISKIKQGLEKSLKDIEYDELTKKESGALVVTGTGKGKKSESRWCSQPASLSRAQGKSPARYSLSTTILRSNTRKRCAPFARMFTARTTSPRKAAMLRPSRPASEPALGIRRALPARNADPGYPRAAPAQEARLAALSSAKRWMVRTPQVPPVAFRPVPEHQGDYPVVPVRGCFGTDVTWRFPVHNIFRQCIGK